MQLIFSYIKVISIGFLLFLGQVWVFAQEDTLKVENAFNLSLEELLSVKIKVSSVKAIDLLSTPSSVTIIDRSTIERYNFASIAEALAIVPGIDVLQTVIDWNVTTSRGILQNFYANKILLMINNTPTWQPIYGDGHLERIDINDVERIEVLKGPGSVLYGSNAYTGVVNIILKENKDNIIEAHGIAGVWGTIGGGYNLKYNKNDVDIFMAVNAGFEDRKPYVMQVAEGFEHNGETTFNYNERYQVGNITLAASVKDHNLLINGFNFDHTYMGAIPSYSRGGGTIVDNRGILTNYKFNKQISNKLELAANMGYDWFNRHFFLDANRSELVKIAAARAALDIKLNYILSDFFSFELGALQEYRFSHGHETWDAIVDTLANPNMINDDFINEGSFFFYLRISFSKFDFVIGARYTNNSVVGGDLSYRFSALYNINKYNSLKLIGGRSFRAPAMFELYFDHYTVVGNLDLKPEFSHSIELAYLSKFDRIFTQLNVFAASYSDLIERVIRDTLQPIYMNFADFWGGGAELEINYREPGIANFFINYNYITGLSSEAEKNYQFVPDHTISLGASKDIRHFNIYTKGRIISKTEGHLETISPQYYIDIGIGYRQRIKAINVRHIFEIKNVTNSDFNIPEYIRQTANINSIPTMGYGIRFIYTMKFNF